MRRNTDEASANEHATALTADAGQELDAGDGFRVSLEGLGVPLLAEVPHHQTAVLGAAHANVAWMAGAINTTRR